jgi:hypothetical protein
LIYAGLERRQLFSGQDIRLIMATSSRIPSIHTYGLDWHLHNSEAFEELIIRPLAPWFTMRLESWDQAKKSFASTCASDPNAIHIFCQIPPPLELGSRLPSRMVWLPMWDHVQHFSATWWRSLPRHLKIVALSGRIAIRAKTAGLQIIRGSYYPNPTLINPCHWQSGRRLFYWNRIGLVGAQLLAALCTELEVNILYFRDDLDPNIDHEHYYTLPDTLGKTRVIRVPRFSSRRRYLEWISDQGINIYLAPRLTEGVGLNFLEAMTAGCAVLAANSPTMNEYISHGVNGWLLRQSRFHWFQSTLQWSWVRRMQRRIPMLRISPQQVLSSNQGWARIRSLNLEQIGRNARAQCILGHENWMKFLPDYANFISEWPN